VIEEKLGESTVLIICIGGPMSILTAMVITGISSWSTSSGKIACGIYG
jgi:hypothetical protein